MVSPEIWLTTAEPTGWQIYKEPESPVDPKERPLRNLILQAKEEGKNIRTWYQDLIFTPESLTSYLNNGKFRWWDTGDWELTKREANMLMPEPEPPREPEYVICKRCGGTGYEIKLEPNKEQFEVGDWVEWCGDQYMVESAPPQSGGRYDIRSPYDELGCSVYPENITRKLSPSEVIVNIGCLSGTVEKAYGEKKGTFILSGLSGQRNVLWLSMLDAQTRELVESLLEAMQGEEK